MPIPSFTFRKNCYSPWGQIENIELLADGIYRVETASHGGIYLSPARREQMAAIAPHFMRAVELNSYAPKPAWWEEDCEAALVLIAFWDELPAAMRRTDYYKSMVRTANSTYGLTLSEAA
jgi:hypothetical protein